MKHLLTNVVHNVVHGNACRNIWMTNTDGLMGWCQMQMLQEELVRLTYQGVILEKYGTFKQMVLRFLHIVLWWYLFSSPILNLIDVENC